MKRFNACLLVLFLVLPASWVFALESSIQPTGLLQLNRDKAFDGYTLVTSTTSKRAFLMDLEGNVVHKWQMKYPAGLYAYLLTNGNLLAGGSRRDEAPVNFGGSSGMITEYDWDGNGRSFRRNTCSTTASTACPMAIPWCWAGSI